MNIFGQNQTYEVPELEVQNEEYSKLLTNVETELTAVLDNLRSKFLLKGKLGQEHKSTQNGEVERHHHHHNKNILKSLHNQVDQEQNALISLKAQETAKESELAAIKISFEKLQHKRIQQKNLDVIKKNVLAYKLLTSTHFYFNKSDNIPGFVITKSLLYKMFVYDVNSKKNSELWQILDDLFHAT